jgi:hypothetical protein
VLESYSTFFADSMGASAAFNGPLFAAVTIDRQEQRDEAMSARRVARAGCSFTHLMDTFVVLIVAVMGVARHFAGASEVMAILGVEHQSRIARRHPYRELGSSRARARHRYCVADDEFHSSCRQYQVSGCCSFARTRR